MPGILCRQNPSAPQRARDEAGFALVEVMVSAVLLLVLSLATLSVIDRAQTTSSNSRSRDVAAQLAQSEQDVIRQMPISALAGGYHPADATKTVGGIDYLVSSEADWVTDSGGAVTCSTTGRVAYLRSTSTVTWPGMGTIKPVIADAIVDPGVAALGANKGALTVLLTGADGTGTSGITVTAGGISGVTDENGCAVIANLDSGAQTLTYNSGGYVDKDGKSAVSKPVTVGAGTISQASGLYDSAGVIHTDLANDGTPGVVAASWPTVSFDNALRTTPTLFKVLTTGAAQNAADAVVFPFSSAYKAYVGDCTGNDPSTYSATPGGGQVNPGQTKIVSLPMRTVTVTVAGSASGLKTTLFVTPDKTIGTAMSSCATTTFSNSAWSVTGGGTATFKIAVPYGVWKVCANHQYSNGKWAQTPTVPGGVASDDPLISTPAGTTTPYVPDLAAALTMPGASTQTGAFTSC
jgi:Tfp pilus assembly protein PilV